MTNRSDRRLHTVHHRNDVHHVQPHTPTPLSVGPLVPTNRSPQKQASIFNKRTGFGRGPAYTGQSIYTSEQSSAKPFVLAAVSIAVILIIGAGVWWATHTSNSEPTAVSTDTEAAAAPTESRVHFVAVGDNLPDQSIGFWADAQAGEPGDGDYDYRGLYTNIKPYIQHADLAYIDQETHIGGDEFGPRGYPSFNTTSQMADAVVDTGFDLVASATNHSYDWGYFGAVEYSRSVWNTKDVVFTGTASSAEEAATIPVVEKNGITFALLNYTYGVNGYEPSQLEPYKVNFIDTDRITHDVEQAHTMADIVLVAMHWGTENLMEADDYQQQYAQLLADLGVDIVLGSHPHVIGPLQWVEGSQGNRTLVAYSLGNFISNHDYPEPTNELEGMLSCDIVKVGEDTRVESVVWTPLINHHDGSTFSVYAAPDYTQELAQNHPIMSRFDDVRGWIYDTTHQVIGDEFTINMDTGAAQ